MNGQDQDKLQFKQTFLDPDCGWSISKDTIIIGCWEILLEFDWIGILIVEIHWIII